MQQQVQIHIAIDSALPHAEHLVGDAPLQAPYGVEDVQQFASVVSHLDALELQVRCHQRLMREVLLEALLDCRQQLTLEDGLSLDLAGR